MSPDAQPQATSTTGPPSWMAPVQPAVPDHELIRRIGGGSYGDVWLARTTVGSWRAVKVVFRDRFTDTRPYEREFSGMLKFEPLSRSNEAFVDILQIGRNDADGYFYYVMELADDANAECGIRNAESQSPPPGVVPHSALRAPHSYVPLTLSKVLLQRGRLPVTECLDLGLTLNLGLAHLHRAGLIHRDIKPSNIIFVGGVPKLADIGLVIEVAEARSFVGTEGFIPPEGPTSPQADLFSLGKVLYEASMGKDRKDFPEPLTQLAEAPDRTQLLELNAILLKACAASRAERYQSAEEMNADLALLQSGGSVRQQRKLAGQLRFVQRAGALVTALAAVIALGWWWQATQTRVVRTLSEEKSRLAEENRERVVRLNVANGIRLLDADDPGGALLWFAEALPLVTNNPAVESIHRIRIEQTLHRVPRLHQLLAHEHEVTASAFSGDGRHIAAGTESGYMHLWDSRSGRPLFPPLDLGLGPIHRIQFSRDGTRVFAAIDSESGSAQGTSSNFAAVLSTETGRQIYALAGTNLVGAAATPDDRWLVTAEASGTIRLHDTRDGRPLREIDGPTSRPLQLAFNSKASVFAVSSEDFPARFQTIRVWRLPDGEPVVKPLRCARGPIALNPDGRFLAVAGPAADGGADSIVQIWDLESEEVTASTTRVAGVPLSLGIVAPEGRSFWVLTDQRCVLLDPFLGRARGRPITPPGEVTAVAVSPDGRMVAFGGKQGFAGAWSFETGERVLPPLPQEAPTTDLRFSSDGGQILVASLNGTVLVLGSRLLGEDGLCRFDAPLGGASLQTRLDPRCFTPGRRQMLLILDDGSVRLVDFEQMSERVLPSKLPERKRALLAIFDASGRRRAVGYGRSVELRTETRGTFNHFILPMPQGLVEDLRFSPDGDLLAAVGSQGHVRLWSTVDGSLQRATDIDATGDALLTPEAMRVLARSPDTGQFRVIHLLDQKETSASMLPSRLAGLCFSPSGDRFASFGHGNWTRVWRVDTFEPVTPPLDHGGPVQWVDWSPDGRQLLTAGLTPEVRIWDEATGEPRQAPLTLGSELVRTASWSLDGRFVVARSDGGTVRVWDAATGDPVTPLLPHEGTVELAQLVADQRLVTLSSPDRLRAWDLRECRSPASVLADLARLFSGRRLTSAGATLRLTSGELGHLFNDLRKNDPKRFTTSSYELSQWHRREVGLTLDLAQLNTALFHLDRLAELALEDPGIRQLRARYQSRRVPPHDPKTPANLLDLSAFYTSSLDTTMYEEFAELPRGLQTLAGTLWDLRGFVTVGSDAAVTRIPVGQRCLQLSFLQFVGGFHVREGDEVAHWLIRYVDGSTVEWPLIYGEQLRDWWWNYDHPRDARQATIAWEGHPNILANAVRLFKATWTNPHPEVAIESLDLVGGKPDVSTSVVAVTAE